MHLITIPGLLVSLMVSCRLPCRIIETVEKRALKRVLIFRGGGLFFYLSRPYATVRTRTSMYCGTAQEATSHVTLISDILITIYQQQQNILHYDCTNIHPSRCCCQLHYSFHCSTNVPIIHTIIRKFSLLYYYGRSRVVHCQFCNGAPKKWIALSGPFYL